MQVIWINFNGCRTFQPWTSIIKLQSQTIQPQSQKEIFNPKLFNHELFNPGLSNHELFNHDFLSQRDKKFRVEKSWVEKSGMEMSWKLIVRGHSFWLWG